MLFGHPFQCIAFCHHVFVGNFLTRTVYLFSVHCKSASMFIEALDIFYSFAIFLQFGSFFFSRLTVQNRHFLCTGNHRKQFSAASKIKRSMNQYSLLEMCFGGIFHNIFFFSHCWFFGSFFTSLFPPSFDSVSHQSEGRTVQTISEYKLSLNLLQGELFS